MLDTFALPFVQRGLVQILLLALAAGLLGTWVVLRGMAFFSHAVGAAAFPGLVLADGLGFAAPLGAAASALLFAVAVVVLGRRERNDSATALALVAALAVGVVLASDVFGSTAGVDTLLFGSLLSIGDSDIAFAAVAAAAVICVSAVTGPRWLITGFDPGVAAPLGARPARTDAVLLALTAFVAVAALSAVGALLATAMLVVPAATARLLVSRMRSWQVLSTVLAAAEGVLGLWLSVELNAPPGATVAVLAGVVFAVVAVGRALQRSRRGTVLAGVAALAALGAAGCGGDDRAGAGEGSTTRVVATTTQLGDLVRIVGGDAIDVTQILQPNSDPHDYEPRPDDVRRTAGADVVFRSGGHLDSWMEEVAEQSGGSPAMVVVGDDVPVHRPLGEEEEEEHAAEGEAEEYDPHWWHDPRNAEAAVATVRDALTDADPEDRDRFRANADAYLAKLETLDRGIAACVGSIPAARRKLVTDHDAFGYFAARYGIEVVGAVIPAQTTQAQPSAGEVADLVRLIEREHVSAVFPESSVNADLARTIAAQTGASADNVLYGDTLGPADSDGATYLTMERHNADAIVRGLTGGERGCAIPGL